MPAPDEAIETASELPASIETREEGTGSFSPVPEFNPSVALEEVTLIKPHTHDDRDYAIGDKLTVQPPIAEWLRQHGVIDPKDPA